MKINTRELLPLERQFTIWLTVILTNCIITGLSTYVIPLHNAWIQWSVLFHLVTGISLSFLLLFYYYLHFHRTLGFRRAGVLLSGLLSLLLALGFILSGWAIAVTGQQESRHWVYVIHILTSLLFLVILLLHLVLHKISLPENRKGSFDIEFRSIPTPIFKLGLYWVLGTQILLAISSIIYDTMTEPYRQTAVVSNYEYPYGPYPFHPSQTETSTQTFIDTRQIANSERCLHCHADIGKQWLASVHKLAASDPSYVTNINLLEKNKGISATRYCEGCHAPVALLTGELSPGGKHGGISGTLANLEGISCMGCHGIDALSHLKGNASFRFKPAEDYLFAQSDNGVLTRINNWLIRLKPDQHKIDMANPLLKDASFCSSCHTQFMDKDMNNWGWVKMQDDYAAWLEGPFSHHHQETFATASMVRCQDCHMPLEPADDPSADQDGNVRTHYFPGANTVLPTLYGDKQQLARTREFLQANRLRISIDRPTRSDAVQNQQSLNEKLRHYEEAPYYYYLGETAQLNIMVSNQGVGHSFPGGSIDIGEAWIEFIVVDAQGQSVYSSGIIDANNHVDASAHFYRSLPVDRGGQLVWKHDLFNMVGVSFRRVIKSGESDLVNYSFKIPAWAKSPLTATATLKYRKFNERYASWALGNDYVQVPVIDMAWHSLTIPVKIRKPVE